MEPRSRTRRKLTPRGIVNCTTSRRPATDAYAETNKLRLSAPYYLQKKDIDRFLEKLDDYQREKKLT